MEWLVLIAALLLAFVNGANDNFKGVATLYGSGALSYRQALALASVSTLLGSLLSLALASGLIHAFSGKGIIPAELLEAPLLASVALAATITVLLATRLGFPISTTHALVGGIAGGGIVAAGGALEFFVLARAFALPLLVGPLLAVALAYLGLRLARRSSGALSLEAASCVCLAQTQVASACPVHPLVAAAFAGPSALDHQYRTGSRFHVSTGTEPACHDESADRVVALSVYGALTLGHLLSAGLVGFARGLNDTPKIVGLVVGVGIVSMQQGTAAVALMMTVGGLISARRVAEKLSHEITPMTPSQGLVGNFVTSGLVIAASRYSLPVSTTHVSTGAIFGIGGEEGSLNRRTFGQILAAWVVTLPMAAGIAAALMWWQPWM
jgi:PiT family inorganic phosphate transporter